MTANNPSKYYPLSGGQFEPVSTGQFEPAKGGQLKPVGGGQLKPDFAIDQQKLNMRYFLPLRLSSYQVKIFK